METRISRSRCWKVQFLVKVFLLTYSLFTLSSHGLSSMCMWRKRERQTDRQISGVSSSSYKDTSLVELGLYPYYLFNLNYLLSSPISQNSHRALVYEF